MTNIARTIDLSMEEYEALQDALSAYLNGTGIALLDPAEHVLEDLLDRL